MKISLGSLWVLPMLAAPLFPAQAATPANTSARHARRLHFTRGATTLSARGHLSGSQRRFYRLKTRAGQRLTIRVAPASTRMLTLVPLLRVTPPRGQSDGDKTAIYQTQSTRAGDYKIEVAPNLMASNARRGPFILRVSTR